MSAEDAAKKVMDRVAPGSASKEGVVIENSLSKSDVSIILGRALEGNQPVGAIDLSNCNVADIAMMRFMVGEELNLRLRGGFTDSAVYEGLKFNYSSGGKADLLTRQLDLKNEDLTDKQVSCLIRILSQLGSKIAGYIDHVRLRIERTQFPED